MRKYISNEEKLNLILEYINERGEQPIYSSEYKGFQVGVYLIYLRKLAFEKRELDERTIQIMKENGLLEKKCEFIEEKIFKLEKFCREYPQIWRYRVYKSRDELFEDIPEEREKVEQLLEQAISDYRYIVLRKSQGKISSKDIRRLREAGVGYKFEDSTIIEKIVQEYRVSKNDLEVVCNKYGSLKNFKKEYAKALIEGKIEEIQKNIPQDIYKKLIKGFDISQPDFIKRDEGEERLIRDIVETKGVEIVNLEPVKEKLEEIMKRKDRKKQFELVSQIYGIYGECEKSNLEVAKKYGISSEAVRQSRVHAINALRRTEIKIIYEEKSITGNRKVEFIDTFFRHYDVFIPNDYLKISKAVREKIERLCKKEEKVRTTYKRKMEIYGEIKISKTRLSGYIVNRLDQMGIENIEELTQYSAQELEKKFKLSKKTIAQISEALEEFGLGLGKTTISNIKIKDEEKKLRDEIFDQETIESRRIESLDLSVRLYNILRRNGIEKIKDIGELSDKQNIERLLQMKGMGTQYLNELICKINNIRELNSTSQEENTKTKNESKVKDIVDIKIEDTEYLNKYTILKKLISRGVITLGDLTKYTEEELKFIAGINYQSVEKIKEMLRKYGLQLKEKEDKENGKSRKNEENEEYTIHDKKIEELGLNPSVYNLLRRNGFESVGDIGDISNIQNLNRLSRIKGMGKKSLNEIISKIKQQEDLSKESENIDAELMQAIQELRIAYKQKVQNRIPEHTSAGEER